MDQEWKKGLDELIENPTVSYWLKDAIRAMLRRDPVDAYADAEVLRGIMKARVESLLGKFLREGVTLC